LSEAGVLSLSLKMDKIEYRALIKFFVKEGLTPNEIHKILWGLFSFVFNSYEISC
jgi:hypothetical protein